MTKKDFIALADMLKRTKPQRPVVGPYHVYVGRLSMDMRDKLPYICAASNPCFNRARWLDYIDGTCGPSELYEALGD